MLGGTLTVSSRKQGDDKRSGPKAEMVLAVVSGVGNAGRSAGEGAASGVGGGASGGRGAGGGRSDVKSGFGGKLIRGGSSR